MGRYSYFYKVLILGILLINMLILSASPVRAAFSDLLNYEDFINIGPREKSVTLLAVQDTPAGYIGSLADVTLEIRDGTGRVFLDTFPLSKIDTQISTRFAKEIACKYIENDCSRYDFIYTIRSDSSIIGGPSAGSAISLLTIAMLESIDLDSKTAITGTINSGGIIGPVSGIKYKIDAAKENGFERVLIPEGSVIEDLENNVTFDMSEYEKQVRVDIVEVSTLNDAMKAFTGKDIISDTSSINLPDKYENTMKIVADSLCNRSEKLYQVMKDQFRIIEFTQEEQELSRNLEDEAINLTARADSAMDLRQYYSAASYCYGANIKYRNVVLLQQNQEGQRLFEVIDDTAQDIEDFEDQVDSIEFRTLSDFEVFIIMKERIETAKDFLTSAIEEFENQNTYNSYYNLAYAIERLHTAAIWRNFVGLEGREFDIDQDVLKSSCMQKISETQERVQYVKLFAPASTLEDIQDDLNMAYGDYDQGEYALCISKASRAKANTNVIMSLMKGGTLELTDLVGRKLNATRQVIVKEQQKNVFPIMGYSYYEYAKSMQYADPVSALIYAEYALELSWLDIYFRSPNTNPISITLNPLWIVIALIGFIFGAMSVIAMLPRRSRFFKRRFKFLR